MMKEQRFDVVHSMMGNCAIPHIFLMFIIGRYVALSATILIYTVNSELQELLHFTICYRVLDQQCDIL